MIPNNIILIGDILINIIMQKTIKDKIIANFSINTAFLSKNNPDEDKLNIKLSVDEISPYGKKKSKYFNSDFELELEFL